ncbi:substrate-binding and VWA domain-containing protein [Planosporangium sp. 12N6]|uniref:substrate-binding and VWA domain-containing protein n=1 Tax=Planosporangium spinosum TaxID=3402278 RepID=UPI003CEA547F
MVVLLVAGTVVAVRAVTAGAAGCTAGVPLTVAVNPDIYPPVREIAARWAATDPRVDDNCIRIQVNPVPAADVANALAVRAGAGAYINVAARPVPTPADDEVPAVWIPDSSSWTGRVRAVNRDAFDDDFASVATSPVVLAMPEPLAGTVTGGAPRRLTGQEVADLLRRSLRGQDKDVRLGIAEPRRDAAGLVGAVLTYDAVATGPAQLPALVGAYRTVAVGADRAAVLAGFGQGQTVAPLTEQAVVAHDAGSPATPLVAVPLDAGYVLDYPYARVAGKPRAVARAADLFRAALQAPAARQVLARAAFRDPSGAADAGFPTGHGVTADPVAGNPLDDPKKIADVLGVWSAAKIPSRIVSSTDITAATAGPLVPGGPPLLQIVQKTQLEGLKLFTDDSEMATWEFAAGLDGGRAYREKVPMGQLGAVQRDKINLGIMSSQSVPTTERGLYETVLAGYRAVRDGWDPDRSNTVLVFTSGGNTKPDGLTLDDVQLELEKLTDPTKPIRVVLLGFGPEVNLDELNAIAKTSGGKAFKVERPEEIGSIFLEALLRS